MKKILTSVLALSVLAAGAAHAQPGQRHDNNYGAQYQQGGDRNGGRDVRNDRNDQYERRADRHFKADRYKRPKGYQVRHWRRGEALPSAYRSKAYTVDYRRYNLAPPPRGYQYVRVDNDVVLTAVASGVIASVITQLFQ